MARLQPAVRLIWMNPREVMVVVTRAAWLVGLSEAQTLQTQNSFATHHG